MTLFIYPLKCNEDMLFLEKGNSRDTFGFSEVLFKMNEDTYLKNNQEIKRLSAQPQTHPIF